MYRHSWLWRRDHTLRPMDHFSFNNFKPKAASYTVFEMAYALLSYFEASSITVYIDCKHSPICTRLVKMWSRHCTHRHRYCRMHQCLLTDGPKSDPSGRYYTFMTTHGRLGQNNSCYQFEGTIAALSAPWFKYKLNKGAKHDSRSYTISCVWI